MAVNHIERLSEILRASMDSTSIEEAAQDMSIYGSAMVRVDMNDCVIEKCIKSTLGEFLREGGEVSCIELSPRTWGRLQKEMDGRPSTTPLEGLKNKCIAKGCKRRKVSGKYFCSEHRKDPGPRTMLEASYLGYPVLILQSSRDDRIFIRCKDAFHPRIGRGMYGAIPPEMSIGRVAPYAVDWTQEASVRNPYQQELDMLNQQININHQRLVEDMSRQMWNATQTHAVESAPDVWIDEELEDLE